MNALILGGQSPRHKEWIRHIAAVLEPRFDEVRLLDYRHWREPDTEMDIEYEIAQAAELAKDFGDYVVVAKSIGTVITILASARGMLRPKRCVFMGFPLKVVEHDLPGIADALTLLPPTAFLHNEHDPLGSAEAVLAFVRTHAPTRYEFKTLPGYTHDYVDFALIAELAARS